MDMKVDSNLIKSEREKRAWSQEHFARVTGLGLRTIQRIEKTGAASFESAQALAAVFSIDVAVLRVENALRVLGRRFSWPVRPLLGAAAALLTVGGALFVATTGFAEQVMLDIGISLNDDQSVEKSRLLTDANDDVDVTAADDSFRLVILPTIEANGIMLSTRIFERQGREYILVSEPRLLTGDGKEAEARFVSETGKVFRFVITPHRNPQRIPSHLKAIRD